MPFTVKEFRDLIRILEEKPEWRAELRRLVLTEELLSLPEQVAALRAETERRFQEMAAEISRLSAAVAKLEAAVAKLEVGMGDLVKTQKRLIIDVADLKGERLERRYRERAPAYFRGLIRRARALTTEDLDELLEPAVDRGHLSEDEAKEVLHSDVVVRGRRREDDSEVYLVVEVSSGVGPGDVERAARRAEILSRSGVAALAVLAGERITADASRRAREMHVRQVTDGMARRPE